MLNYIPWRSRKEHPSAFLPITADSVGLTHYLGNPNVVHRNETVSLSDLTTGSSNNWLVGEVSGRFQPFATAKQTACSDHVFEYSGTGSLSRSQNFSRRFSSLFGVALAWAIRARYFEAFHTAVHFNRSHHYG
ncbi:MAG TPA: hypothetical protein PK992_17675, partial [Planctomycetaceae bacterium]|nr:hypothetical protein [Planctomycetaceae bacterium]